MINLRNSSSDWVGDATDNYYEYEASLKYTAPNATSPLDIWPNENTVRLAIQDFVDLKILRDKNSTVTNERFTWQILVMKIKHST